MKNSLNRITNRQYLIDITLYELKTNYTKDQAKIICELHYEENYVKFKNHSLLKNNVADFEQEKLTIPFSTDIALVFKQIKANRRQDFLGHYSLEIQQYLKQGRLTVNSFQKLNETDSWVKFQCKIIDKTTLQQSSLDQISEQDNLRKSQFSVMFQQQPNDKMRIRPMTYRAHSQFLNENELRQSFNLVKSYKDILLPQQFQKKLHQAQEIVYKKELQKSIQVKLQKFKRNGKGCLKTQKIVKLQTSLIETKKQAHLKKILIYFALIVCSSFMGLIIS